MAAVQLLTDKRVQEVAVRDHADAGELSLRIDGDSGKSLHRYSTTSRR